MYANTVSADVSSSSVVTGFRDDHRRTQLGFKFEF
jgi:hypothetical protein